VELKRRARRFVKGLPLGRRVLRFFWALREHGAYRAASAMAFDAFMSFVPLLALAAWILNGIGQGEAFIALLTSALPFSTAELSETDPLRISTRAVVTLAPLSALVFLWLSSAGIATAMGVCEVMFEATQRPWLRRRLIAFGCVFAALAAIALATLIVLGSSRALGAPAGRVVSGLVMAPMAVALVIGFYRAAILRPRGMRRHVWPGAVLTVALWAVCSVGFSVYVRRAAQYALFYGGLATVAITMLWLWLMSLALLIGGELNAQLEGVREFPPSTVLDGVRTTR
jgi:membrane protein